MNPYPTIGKLRLQRGMAFGILIVAALIAFEIFNYCSTDYALGDLLGDLRFMGIRWATILAIAFCGIDFAGIARLFTPEEGPDEPREVWYLFGAWLLAATMNAMLTWWGTSLAILNHNTLGNVLIPRQTLLRVVPIFVAILVWLIRVLIIGTFSVAGERIFSLGSPQVTPQAKSRPWVSASQQPMRSLGSAPSLSRAAAPSSVSAFRPAPKTSYHSEPGSGRSDRSYVPVQMSPFRRSLSSAGDSSDLTNAEVREAYSFNQSVQTRS